MLIIKPIQEKPLQATLCHLAGIPDDPACLAYFAADGSPDDPEPHAYLGICLFSMDGQIHALTAMPGVQDDEALMIMARTAMNFLYRFGVMEAVLRPEACGEALADRLGFRTDEKGRRSIDLLRFYESPCHYSGDQKRGTE